MTQLKPSDYRVGEAVEYLHQGQKWVPARVVTLHVEDDGLAKTPFEYLDIELYNKIRRRCYAPETTVWIRKKP